MQSKTVNRGVLMLPLFLMDMIIATVVRPFNLAGLIVMNVVAVLVMLGGLRLFRK